VPVVDERKVDVTFFDGRSSDVTLPDEQVELAVDALLTRNGVLTFDGPLMKGSPLRY
jgi:hypothetical protein